MNLRVLPHISFLASLALLSAASESMLARGAMISTSCLPQTSEFLSALTAENEEWHRIIVRYPKSERRHEPVSPQFDAYSRNTLNAMKSVFDPWFKNGKDEDFESTLDQMWEIMTGKNSDNPYEGWYKASAHGKAPYGRRKHTFQMKLDVGSFRNRRSYPIRKMRLNEPGFKKDLRGIPSEHQPIVFNNFVLGPIFSYPAAESVQFYLSAMRELMGRIRNSNASTEELLPLLAEYYQIGITAHIYDRVNNSLLLAQINYVLLSRGLRGIPHRDLDFQAMALSTEDFTQVFSDDVKASQGATSSRWDLLRMFFSRKSK